MNATVVMLHEDDERVIDVMAPDWVYPFSEIAEETGLSEKQVRKIVRNLRAQGLAKYGVCYSEDDGHPNGSGYTLTREGHQIQQHRRTK